MLRFEGFAVRIRYSSEGALDSGLSSLNSTVDLMGVEPIAPILQGSVASIGMQARVESRVQRRESRDRNAFQHRLSSLVSNLSTLQ